MSTAETLITEHLDTWASAIEAKSSAGRGGGKKEEFYGIKKLRELILELAVRGLLVPQDPKDEPASELLMRVAAEREQLIRARIIKNAAVRPNEKFVFQGQIPQSWILTTLGMIGDWGSGSTPKRDNPTYYGGNITWLKSGELNDCQNLKGSSETITEDAVKSGSFRENKIGDVLIAMYGATIGKIAILAEPAVTNQAVCGTSPFEGIFNKYLFIYLLSQRGAFHAASEGGAQPNISKVKLLGFPFPLPPLAEQHRIVAKVDELMALCDQLEQKQEDSVRTHGTLVRTLLGALTAASDRGQFDEAWQRIQANFDTLFTTENSIDELKQTILQLAVMGKLVPQDANDEPASDLLRRVLKEKTAIIEAGDMRKQKKLPAITPDEQVFALPVNWVWARLEETIVQVTDGEHISPRKTESGVKLLTAKHIRAEGVSTEDPQFVSEADARKFLKRCNPEIGDVFICSRGTIGRSCVNDVEETFCLMGSVILLKKSDEISPHYINYFIKSPTGQFFIRGATKGMAVNALYLKDIKLCPIPLPPLSEQLRIVAIVDDLMTNCESILRSLQAAQSTQIDLADSLVEAAIH